MRLLRGLHVEDCYLTYRLVQGVFRTQAHVQLAESREKFLSVTPRVQYDFMIVDGDIPGWPLQQYVADLKGVEAVPIFVFSGNSYRRLGLLGEIKPQGVLRKEDGPQVLLETVLSYFYASERFNFPAKVPNSL